MEIKMHFISFHLTSSHSIFHQNMIVLKKGKETGKGSGTGDQGKSDRVQTIRLGRQATVFRPRGSGWGDRKSVV
jgi:hypothetical protein